MTRTLVLPHEPGTEDAAMVRTPLFRTIQLKIGSVQDRRSIVVIDGDPGHGKTFAATAAAQATNRPVYWVNLTGCTTPMAMFSSLHEAITGQRSLHKRAYEIGRDITDLLDEHECFVFVDEAQWAEVRVLRVLRSIYDNANGAFGLILIGQRLMGHLQKKEPGLASRGSKLHVATKPLTAKEIRRFIANDYHPFFSALTSTQLHELYRLAGGNFRAWAQLLDGAKITGAADSLDDGVPDKAFDVLLKFCSSGSGGH